MILIDDDDSHSRLMIACTCRINVNLFSNTPFRDRPKFKKAADNNWNVAIKGIKDTGCIEEIVNKGEIAHFEQFHLFPQGFNKAFLFNVLK